MSARYTGGLVYNPPGGWSGYFDGSGDYLSVASNAAFGYGTGDFTIEFWVYPTSSAGTQVYLDQRAGSVTSAVPTIYTVSGTIYYYVSGSNRITGGTVAANQWSHISICRSGSSTKLFINGTQSGSTFTDTTTYITAPVRIGEGNDGAGAYPYSGYLSNFRIVKGTALYTATFTLPTGALQPISGTSLLTCAYSTFRDGSTNNFTITVTGNTAVNTANPFPTSQSPNPALGGAGNGIYTMSQYAALLSAGTWPAIDPYYENTVLNLHGNAGTVLPFNTDASTNNFQVTQAGDTRPSNLTPFITNGYWSNYFVRSSSQYLTVSNSGGQFSFGTDAFTIECWVNLTSLPSGTGYPASYWLFGGGPVNSNPGIDFYINNTQIGFNLTNFTSPTAIGNHGISAGTWYHVAVVRGGTSNQTLSIYVNGSRVATASGVTATADAATTGIAISAAEPSGATSGNFDGYISNHRIVKGTAVYDPTQSTLTVPTTPLTAIANTQLLTCQSNRFVDNSTNAFTITTSGSPSVNPLQPFTAPTGTSAYGSGYFDGSGDYLAPTTSSAFAYGTGDLTFECWIYATTASDSPIYESRSTNSNTDGFTVTAFSSTVIRVYTTAVLVTATVSNYTNAWTHVAYTRQGSTNRLFVNGALVATATASDNFSNTTAFIGAGRYSTSSPSAYFTGYISNVRILKGTAQYTATFTPSTTPLTAITNTSLLTVQTNAPSQNNTFLDSSTNNFVITRNGNTTQGTFTPYGSNWSNAFSTSAGVQFPYTSALTSWWTQDFTMEMWIFNNTNAVSGTNSLPLQFAHGIYTTASTYWSFGTNASGQVQFYYYNGSGNSVTSTATASLATWNHIAMVYTHSTGNISLYLNGVSVASATKSGTPQNGSSNTLNLGAVQGTYYNGYISNLRVLNGTALYTTTFTPSTAPLTAITNTQLLTSQSNRFRDNSTNNATPTIIGSPTVQRFSPFSPTAYYQPSVIGGSGYFDGSGDYLTTNYSINWFTYGSYTLEFWVYHTTMSPTNQMYFAGGSGGTGNTIFYNYANGRVGLGINGTNEIVSSSGVIKANTWQHIAYTFNGTTTIVYVDGVQVASGTTAVYANSSITLAVGGGSASSSFVMNGYIANMRLSQSVIYSSAFTPPTSPVTGGALLLNFTNAAIFDNSMMTDWETLGSAQLNTAYKKYGSGSISMLATGDYCRSTQPSTVGDINGGNFTIEFWVYFTSLAADRALISKYGNSAENAGGLGYVLQWVQSSSVLRLVLGVGGGSDALYTWAWSPVVSTWYHVAVTRSGTSGRAFINGVQIGSTSTLSTSDVASPNATQIGKTHTVAQYLLGYMDDVRVTKGVARYTANFTPPTSQVQDQ